MIDLLSCPFCGSTPVWKSKSMAFGTGASGMEPPMRALGCASCPVAPTTPWRDTEKWEQGRGHFKVNLDPEAIDCWNRRAPAPTSDDRS